MKLGHRRISWSPLFCLPIIGGLLTTSSFAQNQILLGDDSDLTNLPIEELINIKVTSVTRRSEKLSGSPAAIDVITNDDIRRSGVTTIAEALRMAPGMQVARLDSHSWAVSARGFNDVYANKLLVLMDGRSVYTPLFSGTYWDQQDTLLEDIDRIEVIRGPGATLWGANAVNGVINIITKPVKSTQGLSLSGGAGTEERGFGSLRYGDKFSESAFYRVYLKVDDRDDSAHHDGSPAGDSWDKLQGGFRTDWEVSDKTTITLQGDAYAGRYGQTFNVPTGAPPFFQSVKNTMAVQGLNALGRLTHNFSDEADFQIQMYYDRTIRNSYVLGETRDTFDLDFQNRINMGERQILTWGLGYRFTTDRIDDTPPTTPALAFSPDHRSDHLVSVFIQDEINLIPDELTLTLGSKFERNDYTGFEFQPSGRLSWAPHKMHNLWAAVSRAVRTPSRAEDDVTINQAGTPAGFAPLRGRRSFQSEEVLAHELGYRVQPVKTLSLDIAAFYNLYDSLRSIEPPTALPGAFLAHNELSGETYGVEVGANFIPLPWWRLRAAYTYLQVQIHRSNTSGDTRTERSDEGKSPQNQVYLRSSIDLRKNFSFDSTLRYVDSLPSIGIPSYVELDLRVAWKPTRNLEFSIVGQNLLDHQHAEFSSSFVSTPQAEIERGVYGKVQWKF